MVCDFRLIILFVFIEFHYVAAATFVLLCASTFTDAVATGDAETSRASDGSVPLSDFGNEYQPLEYAESYGRELIQSALAKSNGTSGCLQLLEEIFEERGEKMYTSM